jgi:hypothetical protein
MAATGASRLASRVDAVVGDPRTMPYSTDHLVTPIPL